MHDATIASVFAALTLALSTTDAGAVRPSPAWVQEGVVYEIFPRVFSQAGDFNGVTTQMDRIKSLGVNILYLMPVNLQGKLKSKGSRGSPYAVRDYYSINPDYGDAASLKRLVKAAHERGLRVILDVVANHTSWDAVLISQHPEYYVHDAAGRILPPRPEWDDVAHLDYRNPDLRRYMTDMLVHWLREFDLDGYRCDAAGELPTDFWEHARTALEAVKPDLMLLAEWEKPELLSRAFNLDYSWKFYQTLDSVVQGHTPAKDVRTAWERSAALYGAGALRLRFIDNQDESRAVVRFGLSASTAAAAIILTMDGVPLIYNGMEAGDTSESTAPALFERIPIFWPIAERRPEITEFYRSMIELRRNHVALTHGELHWLHNTDEQRVVTFERVTPSERLVMIANLSSQPFSGGVEVVAGEYLDITPAWHPASVTSAASGIVSTSSGQARIALESWDFRILRAH